MFLFTILCSCIGELLVDMRIDVKAVFLGVSVSAYLGVSINLVESILGIISRIFLIRCYLLLSLS